MRTRNVVSRTKQALSGAVLAASAAVMAPTSPALAGSDFAAGVVTGVIGTVIVNDINRKKHRPNVAPAPRPAPTRAPAKTYHAPSNATVMQEQNALNFFGFPAGYADGVMGRRTRSAIASYQAWMGYPVSGYLDAYQQQFLLDSYNRAIAGGALTQQQIAANPNGTRGLLLTYRDEMAAPAAAAATPTTQATPTTPTN